MLRVLRAYSGRRGCATILHFEAYQLDDPPRNPGEDDDDYQERVWEWRDNHPDWEGDYERFERVASVDYRCDRCDGFATSIEDLGCLLAAPGDLIESHIGMRGNMRIVAANGFAMKAYFNHGIGRFWTMRGMRFATHGAKRNTRLLAHFLARQI